MPVYLTKTAATQIAKDFLIRVNPSKWNGTSKPARPIDIEHYAAYDIGLPNGCLLYLQLERDPDTDTYCHNAAIYDPDNGTIASATGSGISWTVSVAATILRLCCDIELNTKTWRYLP